MSGVELPMDIQFLKCFQLHEMILKADDVSDEHKARICKKFAEADKYLVDGADEYLQLLDVASNIMNLSRVHDLSDSVSLSSSPNVPSTSAGLCLDVNLMVLSRVVLLTNSLY
ncbi:unnamed protein product [Fraxinus pennsylvanica]|uniref:Replication factor C C-terminal domain-containing protein n=1 Tax=Fraxinus pennsylvanica TaxID=56036 RepID=A0AAD1YRV1_9LAMI|nr:unnamed protein product [Fraxinus pennsylvanica]